MITRFDDDFEFLANTYPSPITWEDAAWRTVEHAWQASRVACPKVRSAIQCVPCPDTARRFGTRSTPRPGWDTARSDILLNLLRLKFAPGSSLAARLLATENQILADATLPDLGPLLMRLREELRSGHPAGE